MKDHVQNLDEEELLIDEMFSWEESIWLTEAELKKSKENYSKYHSFKAEKKAVNVRLLTSDINKIKLKAASMWIPYQTLMTIKMHEFANS